MTSTLEGKSGEIEQREKARNGRSSSSPEEPNASPLDVPAVPTRLKRGELVAIIREGRERL
jgi:hypothetical protein